VECDRIEIMQNIFNLNIIPIDLLSSYLSSIGDDMEKRFNNLVDSELSIDTFNFYVSVSAVYSSKIEGEDIEMDSYIKHKRFGSTFLPDYTKKIDDLYGAYEHAKNHELNAKNILICHSLLTAKILHNDKRGRYRVGNMYVVTEKGAIEYIAVEPSRVASEMNLWLDDLKILIQKKLTIEEIFYFASMLHLTFLKIHPFEDGNGRMSRLIEKWFIANQIGAKAWFIESEKYYYNNKIQYYNSIRKLGIEYTDLNYTKAVDFLKLLPNSIEQI
jgi:Fic family protein